MASWLRQPFFPHSWSWPADRQTHRQTTLHQDICSNRLHLASDTMQPNKLILYMVGFIHLSCDKYIVTDHIIKSGNAIASVCPSVSTLTFEPSDLWPWPFAYLWGMATALLGLKVKVKGRNAVGGTQSEGNSSGNAAVGHSIHSVISLFGVFYWLFANFGQLVNRCNI